MINFSTEITDTEKQLIAQLSEDSIPDHVAIIMDGNGRWAKKRARNRIFGHHQARGTVRRVVEAAREIGVKCLTLYTFSTENWSRSKVEVVGLSLICCRDWVFVSTSEQQLYAGCSI